MSSVTHQCVECDQQFRIIPQVQLFDGVTGIEIQLDAAQTQKLIQSNGSNGYCKATSMFKQVRVGDGVDALYTVKSEGMETKIREIMADVLSENLIRDFLTWMYGTSPTDKTLFRKIQTMQTSAGRKIIENGFCTGKLDRHRNDREIVAGNSDDDDDDDAPRVLKKRNENAGDTIVSNKRQDIDIDLIHPISSIMPVCITHSTQKLIAVYEITKTMRIYTRDELLLYSGIDINAQAPWDLESSPTLKSLVPVQRDARIVPPKLTPYEEFMIVSNNLRGRIGVSSMNARTYAEYFHGRDTDWKLIINITKYLCSEFSTQEITNHYNKSSTIRDFGSQSVQYYKIFTETWDSNSIAQVIYSYKDTDPLTRESVRTAFQILMTTFYNPESWHTKNYGPRTVPGSVKRDISESEHLGSLCNNPNLTDMLPPLFKVLFDPEHRVMTIDRLANELTHYDAICTFFERIQHRDTLKIVIGALFDPRSIFFTTAQKLKILNRHTNYDSKKNAMYYLMQNPTAKDIWSQIVNSS